MVFLRGFLIRALRWHDDVFNYDGKISFPGFQCTVNLKKNVILGKGIISVFI